MPGNFPQYDLATYVLIFLLASWGGFVNFLNFLKDEPRPSFLVGFIRFLNDVLTGAFCGVIAFFGCQTINIPPAASAAIIGLTGHMGSRGLIIAEKLLEMKLKNWTGIKLQNGGQ